MPGSVPEASVVVTRAVVVGLPRRSGVKVAALRVAALVHRKTFTQALLNGGELSIDVVDTACKLRGVQRCGDSLDGGRQLRQGDLDDAIGNLRKFVER